MAFLNYTSTVKVENTIARISKLLLKLRCDEITTRFADGRPAALHFVISQPSAGRLKFRLPANPSGVLAAMHRNPGVPGKYCNQGQAERTSWRIVEDWLKSQIAIIESGQVTATEVFLAHAVANNGRTLYESLVAGQLPQLNA